MKRQITMSAKRTPAAQMPVLDVEDGTLGASDNRGPPRLALPGLIQRPDHQAPPPARPRRGLIQPRHGEPPHHPHRGESVPAGPAEQPLRLIRRAVSRLLSDRPAVPLRQPADYRADILPRLQPRP